MSIICSKRILSAGIMFHFFQICSETYYVQFFISLLNIQNFMNCQSLTGYNNNSYVQNTGNIG